MFYIMFYIRCFIMLFVWFFYILCNINFYFHMCLFYSIITCSTNILSYSQRHIKWNKYVNQGIGWQVFIYFLTNDRTEQTNTSAHSYHHTCVLQGVRLMPCLASLFLPAFYLPPLPNSCNQWLLSYQHCSNKKLSKQW